MLGEEPMYQPSDQSKAIDAAGPRNGANGRAERLRDALHESLQSGAANPDAVRQTEAVLTLIANREDVPDPDFSVDNDGEISLDWDYGRRCVFSVSIGGDGSMNYAGLFGTSKSHGLETFEGAIPAAILANIRRVAAERPSETA